MQRNAARRRRAHRERGSRGGESDGDEQRRRADAGRGRGCAFQARDAFPTSLVANGGSLGVGRRAGVSAAAAWAGAARLVVLRPVRRRDRRRWSPSRVPNAAVGLIGLTLAAVLSRWTLYRPRRPRQARLQRGRPERSTGRCPASPPPRSGWSAARSCSRWATRRPGSAGASRCCWCARWASAR